jgi:hypothetical protein
MIYKIAAILCETPLVRIPFINQWIDDQFDCLECEHLLAALDARGENIDNILEDVQNHKVLTREMFDELDELLKGVELYDEEVKPENVGDWLRRLSNEALK